MNASLVTHSLSFVELEPNVDHSPPQVPLFGTLSRQAINQMKNPSPGKYLRQINDFSDLLAVQTLHKLEPLYVNPNKLQIKSPGSQFWYTLTTSYQTDEKPITR